MRRHGRRQQGVETPVHDEFSDLRIHGAAGTIVVDHGRDRLAVYAADEEPATTALDSAADPFDEQLSAFVETITGETESMTPGLRERNTLAVIRAGYRSLETDAAVSPSYRSA